MDASIGAFEAKAQLSRLLRAVEQGQRFTISVRGKPVADLIPHRGDATDAAAAALAALQAAPRIQGVSDAEVAGFVSEGRL
ncbi:MAG: type II toxin-antitoxin system prevent-host-death family antitoxin [Synechococcaceae bacterium WB9_2_112]|nr:type II toxin-antitoxin system prevent-host-death family antitoxin [Synechococcaceae bacterium WB9_2_112]